jgi:(p)ppGpp synthase/HD superfamily hydrolase
MKKKQIARKAVRAKRILKMPIKKAKAHPSHLLPYTAVQHADLAWNMERLKKLIAPMAEKDRSVVLDALAFSAKRHEGQMRKGGSPYIIHPVRIANILLGEWGMKNPEVITAALLHDVIEDTPTTIKEVKDTFGDHVGKLVDGMTMWKGSETYEIYCKRVSRGSEELRFIKCADSLDNLRSWHEHAQHESLNRWWRQTNDFVLPIAERTDDRVAHALRSLLNDAWYIKSAQMM